MKISQVLIIAGCLLNSALSQAQTIGELDSTFGVNGKVTTDFSNGNDGAQGIAIQGDGKIVVVGYTGIGNNNKFALARYNVNGALDTTFGGTGKVITDFAPLYDYASSVVIQADGKIIAAGQKRLGTSGANALIRYNVDGSLDSTFGVMGKVENAVGVADAGITAIKLQTDGKIVAAGISTNSLFDHEFAVVRYNINGSIDSTFATNGVAMIGFNASADFPFAMDIQTDGKILVAGMTGPDPFFDFGLMRLDTLGALDTTFGAGGKVTLDFGSSDESANAVAVQADGKIILAGYTSSPISVAMVRYDSDGVIDSTFGINGKVLSNLTSATTANAICLQADGKIVLAGSGKQGTNKDFCIMRYDSSGVIDPGFSTNGFVTTDFGATNDVANAVALQSDGQIVAAGVFSADFAVARYIGTLSTGLIDFENMQNTVLIYPNPVNEQATLSYSLSKPENISVKLFSINGSLIKTFIENEHQESSNHELVLNFPATLAKGSYFVVISNGSQHMSLQIIK